MPRRKFRFQDMIYKQEFSRFNSAMYKRSEIIVQTFEGPEARELWEQTITVAHRLVNAHFLNLIGVSPEESSGDPHYIVFDGSSCRSTHHLLASLLRKGTKETSPVGMQIVYGVASGLDFLIQQNISLAGIEETINLFSNNHGHTVLSFTPPVEDMEEQRSASKCRNEEILVCTSLIQKTFNKANHVIYREKLDRHQYEDGNIQDLDENALAVPGHASVSNSMTNTDQHSCRREIVFRPFTSESARKLSSIIQSYHDRLQSLSDPLHDISLPRRFVFLRTDQLPIHTCSGYSREEITLSPDAFRSTVMIHEHPSIDEICFVCGKMIKDLIPKDSVNGSQQLRKMIKDLLPEGWDNGFSNFRVFNWELESYFSVQEA
ncbi:hypothetical protein BT96DRAFT_195151 [Gymnopus androsaceus JB14]|uniref:Uncharacterized protein n=1 Tax=Gymnopus androsaceus JB14 TaxID=1447944 RepID=A0A6A4H850_9AGAR|nr:hypothetical protein BT96DRAFT_195151 [Gymnopus androsaceus JB14]